MRKILSLVLTFVMLISLMAPIGTMAQTAAPTVHFCLRDDLTAIKYNYFSTMTVTTFAGEDCTKFQGNDATQTQMWLGCDNLGSGDLTVSIDVYPTSSVNKYWFATGGHGQLATDINDTMFVRNAWNNLTLVVTRSTNTNTLYVNGTKIGDYTAAISGNALRFITWATSKETQTSTVTYLDDFYIYNGKVTMPVMTTTLASSGNTITVSDSSTNQDVLSAITLSDANYSKEILYNGAATAGTDAVQGGSKLVIKQGDLFIADYTIATSKTIASVMEYHDDLTGLSKNYGDFSTAYFGGENCTKWVGKESYASNGNPETQMWWNGSFAGAGNEDLVLSVSFYPTSSVEAINFATTGHTAFHDKITDSQWVPDTWNTMTVVVDTDTNQNHLYLNNQFISTKTYNVSDTIRFVTWAKDGELPGATIYVDDFYIVKGSFNMPLITTSLGISGKNIDAKGKTYAQVKNAITLNDENHDMAITYKGSAVADSAAVKNGAKLTITQNGVYVGEFTLRDDTFSTFHVHRDGFGTNFGNYSHCNVTNATLNGEPCFLMTGIETTDTGNQMFVQSISTNWYDNRDLTISFSVFATTQIKHLMFATSEHTGFVPNVPLSALKLNKWNEITITVDAANSVNTVYVNGSYFGGKTQAISGGVIRLCVYGSSETGKILGTEAYLDNLVISLGNTKIPAATTTLPLDGMYINGFGGMTYNQIANTFTGNNTNTTYKFYENGAEVDASAKAKQNAHMAVFVNGVFVSEYVLGIDNYTMGEFVKSADNFGKGSFTAGYEVESYGSPLNAMAVLAQYDIDSMVKCNVSYQTISGKQVADVTLDDIEQLEGTYLKYFLLEEGTLKPISNPVTIYPYSNYAIESVVKMYPGFTLKAATFSYDDGVSEDINTIASLDKYGAKATFNLVAKWRDGTSNRLLQYYNDKGSTDEERFAYIKQLYSGHEIASHSYSHPPVQLEEGQTSSDSYGNTLEGVSGDTIIEEFAKNHQYIKDNLDIEMTGIAWPYSGPYNRSDYTTIRNAILDSGYLYARNHTETLNFDLPTDWFNWQTSGHIAKMTNLTDKFVALEPNEMKLLYIWGHSYEYANPTQYGSGDWTTLEENLAKLEDEGVWFATNKEVYDYINAVKKITYDVNTVTNNSDITVYVQVNGTNVQLDAGETYILNKGQSNLPSIACWGDSLTMGQGATNAKLTAYPAQLAKLTGATVYNMGVAGETPVTIASRQGVLDIEITEGFTIPQSSTEEVEIKFAASNGGVVTPRDITKGGWTPCTINGVEGTMRVVINTSWPRTLTSAHFKRNVSGKAVTVNAGDKLIPYAQSVKGDINIIYSGANDGWTVANKGVPSDYSADIPEFLDLLETQGMDSNNKQYIIIGLTTHNDEKWALLDSEMEKKFGAKFLNLRKFISSTNAFELMNMTPTSDDLAAIEAGATPPSFLATGDTTHYNDYGYKLAAIAINNKLTQLGYLN